MRVEEFGFKDIERSLDRSEKEIVSDVKKITSKTALEIKKHAQKIISGHPHFPNLGRTFNYEVKATRSEVTGEVGADIEKAVGGGLVREPGSLDFILEYGALNTEPIPHWRPAAEKQVPLWEKYLEDVAEGALDDRGPR